MKGSTFQLNALFNADHYGGVVRRHRTFIEMDVQQGEWQRKTLQDTALATLRFKKSIFHGNNSGTKMKLEKCKAKKNNLI